MTLISRLISLTSRIAAEFSAVRSEMSALGAKIYTIDINGRFRSYTNERWVGFDERYGIGAGTFQENGGTASEPSILWEQHGPLLKAGHVVKAINLIARPTDTRWLASRIRVYHQSGPNQANTTRTLIASAENFSHPDQEWRTWSASPNFFVPNDGVLIIFVKPAVTNAQNGQYLSVAIALEMEIPA